MFDYSEVRLFFCFFTDSFARDSWSSFSSTNGSNYRAQGGKNYRGLFIVHP